MFKRGLPPWLLSTRLSSTDDRPVATSIDASHTAWWSRHFTLLVFAVLAFASWREDRSLWYQQITTHAFKQHTDQIATRKERMIDLKYATSCYICQSCCNLQRYPPPPHNYFQGIIRSLAFDTVCSAFLYGSRLYVSSWWGRFVSSVGGL
jgi:hypothetical protein